MSKSRLSLIIILALCMLACLFAGCSIGLNGYEDYLDYYNITAHVTYYGNGGYFKSSYIVSRKLEYTTGTKFYEITTNSSSVAVTRDNWNLVGWYEVAQRTYVTGSDEDETSTLYFVLDIEDDSDVTSICTQQADGSYTYTYSGTTVTYIKDNFIQNDGAWLMTQEDYDSYVALKQNNPTVEVPLLEYGDKIYTNEDILEDDTSTYVVAMWQEDVYLSYRLAIYNEIDGYTADKITATYEGTTVEYSEGDILFTDYFSSSSITRDDSKDVPILVNSTATIDATFMGYYYDAEGKNPVSGAAITKEDAENFDEEYTIYALYVPGSWKVVRSASDIFSMFGSGKENYIFARDIDCSTYSLEMPVMTSFSGRIEGCSRTLSNVTFSKTNIANGSSYAIFGKLDGGIINNLNINSITVNYTARGDANLYLLFSSVDSSNGGKISGLTLSDVTVVIKTQSATNVIDNLMDGTTYVADNWLYPDAANFETLYGAATVNGYTITVNGTDVLKSEISG